MHMAKKLWLIAGIGLIALAALGGLQYVNTKIPAPESPAPEASISDLLLLQATKSVSTPTSASPAPKPLIAKFQLNPADTIVSWNFVGAYADNPELVAKAEVEIKQLSVLLDTATSSATILSVGIANQYELLGDGKKQYEYLGRAIKADVNATSGLPWHNLGVLMERLGALETARAAYEKSTLVQPKIKFYHYAYLEFLTTRMKDDAVDIEKEFAAAIQNLGQDTDILSLYSAWKRS